MADKKWQKFERLVAAIHVAEQQGAIVKWNDEIRGRQFDVTIRFTNGRYEYLTVIECKDHKRPVPPEMVDALVTKARDAGANKPIMVSASGYQSGAVDVAKRHDVEILTFSAPQMRFIKINSVRAQQHLEFLFERLLSMMLFLIANVSSYALNLRLAYGECSESSLPPESAGCLPFRPA